MSNTTFLLDMDGVCVDFVSGTAEVLGINSEQLYEDLTDEWSIPKVLDMTEEEFWKEIDAKGPQFWANLEKYPWFTMLWDFLHAHGEVFLCTTPSRNSDSPKGKIMWMQKHLGKSYRNFVLTPHKYLLERKNTILIDDSIKNVDKFRNHGGKAIIFPQPWNKTFTEEEMGYYPDHPIDAVISDIANRYANLEFKN